MQQTSAKQSEAHTQRTSPLGSRILSNTCALGSRDEQLFFFILHLRSEAEHKLHSSNIVIPLYYAIPTCAMHAILMPCPRIPPVTHMPQHPAYGGVL